MFIGICWRHVKQDGRRIDPQITQISADFFFLIGRYAAENLTSAFRGLKPHG